jgi:hypothetical protein
MTQSDGKRGCYVCDDVLPIADPLERAKKLLVLHVRSGGYDHWGPFLRAAEEAASLQREDHRYDHAE